MTYGINAAPSLPVPLAHPNPNVLIFVLYNYAVKGYNIAKHSYIKNLEIELIAGRMLQLPIQHMKLNIPAQKKLITNEFFLPSHLTSTIHNETKIEGASPAIVIRYEEKPEFYFP